MAKVFLVTQGEYSGYHIVAAFSTRERADELVVQLKEAGGWGEPCVEEWDVDEPRERLPPAYVAIIDRDGTVVESEVVDHWTPDSAPQELARWIDGVEGPFFRGYGVTLEHARRSAEELRRQHVTLHGKANA